MDFLSFIGKGEEQPPQARGRRRARGRGRGNSGRPVASAMEVLAFIERGTNNRLKRGTRVDGLGPGVKAEATVAGQGEVQWRS